MRIALTTKVAIVTGGASGIGAALCAALVEQAVEVVLADRQIELAETVAATLRRRGGKATAVELDVRDASAFRDLVAATHARCGRLDYLFNNAGIVIGGRALAFTAADWDEVIDVNIRGVAHGILAAYPLMVRQGAGHIINTASMAGLTPVPLMISYAAAKYAVVGMSRALRMEAAPHGVKVTALCPGLVRTPIMTGGRYGRIKPELDPTVNQAMAESLHPMDPALLAQRVLRALRRNPAIIIEPRRWRLGWYFDRLLPAVFAAASSRVMDHWLRRHEAAQSGDKRANK